MEQKPSGMTFPLILENMTCVTMAKKPRDDGGTVRWPISPYIGYGLGRKECIGYVIGQDLHRVETMTVWNDSCTLVMMLSHMLFHSDEEVMAHLLPQHQRVVATALTLTAILGITGAGLWTGCSVIQQQKFQEFQHQRDTDLGRMETFIRFLQKSLDSLAQVTMQNRRGLELLFLQQGRVCQALGEECCFYAGHSERIVLHNLDEATRGLEDRRRNVNMPQYQQWLECPPG